MRSQDRACTKVHCAVKTTAARVVFIEFSTLNMARASDSADRQTFCARVTIFLYVGAYVCMYSVSKKKSPPLRTCGNFFQNRYEFFNQILHAYYAFLFTLDYEFLFNYLQLWRSYAILIKRDPPSSHHVRNMSTISQNAFSDKIFPKPLEIFSLNFTRILNIHIYARMQIFVQLSPTATKLCHIKCDHPASVLVDGGHSHYGGRA